MSILKLMKEIDRGNFEYENGRIRFYAAGYLNQGDHPAAERKDFERLGAPQKWSIKEQNGITYQMVSVRSVGCPYPDMHPGAYVINDSGSAMIPASVCQKCEHRIKADKRGKLRFPRCNRAIEDRKGEKLDSSLDLLAKATKTVNEMME